MSWTDEEKASLCEAYAEYPPVYSRVLGVHSMAAIQTQATRMGLTRGRATPEPYVNVSPTDWAYFAGLLDGEGTIHKSRVRGRNGNRVVSIANTHEGVMAWLDTTFPGGSFYVQRWEGKPNEWFRRLDVHHIRWTRARLIEALLMGALPYLQIKTIKAIEMLTDISALT